jgi:hypothetical protein
MASYLGLIVMVVSGFWTFALLLSIMMFASGRGSSGMALLDEWSPLSTSRKIAYIAIVAMIILLFVRL